MTAHRFDAVHRHRATGAATIAETLLELFPYATIAEGENRDSKTWDFIVDGIPTGGLLRLRTFEAFGQHSLAVLVACVRNEMPLLVDQPGVRAIRIEGGPTLAAVREGGSVE